MKVLNQGSDNVSNSNSNMMAIKRTRLGLTLIILFGNADMAGEDVLMPHKPSINATTDEDRFRTSLVFPCKSRAIRFENVIFPTFMLHAFKSSSIMK